MNKLKGKIVGVEASDGMALVDVDVDGESFSAIVLEDKSDDLKPGKDVYLVFKETEVSIAKDLEGLISLRNRRKGRIKSLQTVGILSKVVIEYKQEGITAIITARSAQKLSLKENDRIEWLVKATEVSLMYGD